ncbi:hypothetical protein TWF730_009770 [Orbilia blumenaviensis]|uniref:Uncharacterized protein n=1 Tax=Orbilia blumenaviensis TaxID=1796055 RepID=A0AAV9UT09_9PEZI
MPNRTVAKEQTFLANPHVSYKSVRFGNKPITYRTSSANDQSTLSQFGFKPSSADTNKKRRKPVSYKDGRAKRKSLDFDELKSENSEEEEEEEEDGYGVRNPVGKRRRVRQNHSPSDDDNGGIKDEMGEDSFVVNDQFDEYDEESWRPGPAPKRRRSPPKLKRFSSSNLRDQTLTQMYPLTHVLSESEYEEDGGSQGEHSETGSEEDDLGVPVEDIRIKDEPLSQTGYEPEVQIKDEPLSQAEMLGDIIEDRHIKQEDEGITLYTEARQFQQENQTGEPVEGPVIGPHCEVNELPNDPRTPKRPIPTVVPSSYTPPVTPLSPLRHQQLAAILASPSIQRQWRMSGRKLPGLAVTDLSPVAEHQKVDDGSTEENTPIESIASTQPLKRPDFTKNTVSSGSSRNSSQGNVKEMPPPKSKMVPSTQWWEREETFTSNSASALEPIEEVNSQSEVQVRSSEEQNDLPASTIPTAPLMARSAEVEVIPESPVRKRNSSFRSFKPSFSTSTSREPLLRDSSGLHTINTSFFRKESSTIEPPLAAIDDESQISEVSIKSVDRQLIYESNNHNTLSAERVDETQLNTDELDPDATISQSQYGDLETILSVPTKKPLSPSRKGSILPLLPPSSPPQTYRFLGNLNSSPPGSKEAFHSSPNKILSSPVMEFKATHETFELQDQEGEYSNERTDASLPNTEKGSVETLTQWKMRMFGPSQAVPTISQIFGANSFANGTEDDDEDEDEEL